MTKVVVADLPEQYEADLDVERSILGPDIDLTQYSHSGDSGELISACRDADVIIADLLPMTGEFFEELTRCRLVSIAGKGFDHIDLQAARDHKVSICALDEYCTDEVADHVMLLTLSLCRRLTEYHDLVQNAGAWSYDALRGLRQLRSMTIGIVGFGRIGRAIAKRAQGFGMKVIANDYRQPPKHETSDLNVKFCDMDALLQESDVISLSCNLTGDNRHLIDEDAFNRMARRPILINCSRGELIDEKALIDALDSGRISGAGLDVLADEPPDLAHSGLTGRSNVILTPHVAFYSDTSMLECRKQSAANVRRFLDGEHDLVRSYVCRAQE